jgi:hypothetical protein
LPFSHNFDDNPDLNDSLFCLFPKNNGFSDLASVNIIVAARIATDAPPPMLDRLLFVRDECLIGVSIHL